MLQKYCFFRKDAREKRIFGGKGKKTARIERIHEEKASQIPTIERAERRVFTNSDERNGRTVLT